MIYTDPFFFNDAICSTQVTALFGAVPGAIYFALDCDGRIIAANSAMVESRGESDAQQVLGCVEVENTRTGTDHSVTKNTQFIDGSHGRAGWFTTTLAPLCDRQGAIIGSAAIRYRVSMPQESAGSFRRLTPAIQHLEIHYHTKVKMKTLAELCGFSLVQFTRVFTAAFAMTPKRYLIALRIERSQQLLATSSRSIAEISAETGFFDQSHFTRLFRQIAGVTPLAYRKRYTTNGISVPASP